MLLWLVVILVVFWTWICTRRPSWSPNGPFLLPIFGNVLALDSKCPYRTYEQWAKRFGAIFHCRLGAQDLVVLNDPSLIREAMSKPEITNRPNTALFSFVVQRSGITAASGEMWYKNRRLVLHNLRNMGMGKPKLEGLMHTQVKDFMAEILSKNCGRAVELGSSLNAAVLNVTWRLAASEEFDFHDGRADEILSWVQEMFASNALFSKLDRFPWLNYLLPESVFNWTKSQEKLNERAYGSFVATMKQHREELDRNSEPRDILDALLQEQAKEPNRVTDWQIVVILSEFFYAGNDSTTAVLRWALRFLCEHPEAQRRIHEEIDRVVGRDRLPVLSDAVNMPYAEALLVETQRMASTTPLGLPRITTAATTLGGYRIPPGLQVVANIYRVHFDKTLFPDPHQFKPERFIDDSGKFRPDRNVMPFSVGRRQCIAEPLVHDQLFIFLISMLQSFSFRFPDGFKHNIMEKKELAINRKAGDYQLVPERR